MSISRPRCPTTNRYCSSLVSPITKVVVAALASLLLASACSAWTVKSRELVDIEIAASGSLMILVSAPGTVAPGLYEWKSGADQPVKVCPIESPALFSFNRRIVIEHVHADHDSLRLYDAVSCALLGQIDAEGRVQDVDARGDLIAVAVQYVNEKRTLALYAMRGKRGKRIATTDIGRNVELGFAPNGKTLLNFDLGDAANATWQLPSLRSVKTAPWVNKDEVAFVPGAQYVKRYANGALSIVQWSTGKPKYSIRTGRTVRVRRLSNDGRYGVTHERLVEGDLVERLDFATGNRARLGFGSIDHATINANGTKVAWSQRGGVLGDEVTVRRAAVDATGAVRAE